MEKSIQTKIHSKIHPAHSLAKRILHKSRQVPWNRRGRERAWKDGDKEAEGQAGRDSMVLLTRGRDWN